MMGKVRIHSTLTGVRLPRQKLARLGELILAGEKHDGDINLVFVSDARMRTINRTFRHKDKTTDVLSFLLEDGDDPIMGEIYISIAEASRNARQLQVPLNQEILKLFSHGVLHLCGIHHPDPTARARMAAREERYLTMVAGRQKL